MLRSIFNKPLDLEISEQALQFYSSAEFEFSLAGRTTPPLSRLAKLIKLPLSQLKKEARKIKSIEQQFVALLPKSIERPNSINRIMRELDPLLFLQDHGWRNIITALHTGGDELNELRSIAVAKYMQYLASYQEIIKRLYIDKKKKIQETGSESNYDHLPDEEEAALPDRTTFEPVFLKKNDTTAHLERIPKGASISLDLKKGEKIDLLLSKHKCRLVGGPPILFLDQTGRKYRLDHGKNVIGREKGNTVAIEAQLKDVSRVHLIVEIQNKDAVVITDFSSHGTYIPKKYIEQGNFA